MKTVYLRREYKDGIRCVFVYTSPDAQTVKCIFNGIITSLPNKARKIITINSVKYKCAWIDNNNNIILSHD